MSNIFPFDARPLETVARLRDLADDIERLNVFRPADQLLQDAPLLSGWELGRRTTPCLTGAVTGHPALGDRIVSTSELFAIDAKAGWARTFSRFYRLDISGLH